MARLIIRGSESYIIDYMRKRVGRKLKRILSQELENNKASLYITEYFGRRYRYLSVSAWVRIHEDEAIVARLVMRTKDGINWEHAFYKPFASHRLIDIKEFRTARDLIEYLLF